MDVCIRNEESVFEDSGLYKSGSSQILNVYKVQESVFDWVDMWYEKTRRRWIPVWLSGWATGKMVSSSTVRCGSLSDGAGLE